MKSKVWFPIAILIAFWPSPERCDAMVDLSLSTGDDLSQLTVGASVSVSVELSGLASEAELDSLFATVRFDGDLLGTPSLVPGAIVPNPLDDPLDLVTATSSGLADAAFLTFSSQSSHHITSEGVFYVFDVTTQKPGSGTISLDFVDATQFNAANPSEPLLIGATAGTPLSFAITDADFDQDGDVDGDDFLAWQGGFGIQAGATFSEGDADGDGDVDGDDFLIWQSQFGVAPASGGAASIPEPASSLVLLLTGLPLALKLRSIVHRTPKRKF